MELLSEKSVTKALNNMDVPNIIVKAGKKVSGARLQTLKDIQEKVTALISEVDEKEDNEMNSEDLTKAIAKAMEPITTKVENIEKNLNQGTGAVIGGTVTKNDEDVVAEAIAKALEPITAKVEAVSATVEAIAKARNLPNNLNNEGDPIAKENSHYLAGIL